MSLILHETPKFTGESHSLKQQNIENNGAIQNAITGYKIKRAINYAVNGTASLCSLFTFLNGNFNFFDGIQEKLEPLSEVLSKVAFSTVHIIGAVDLWQKKNIFPFLGYAAAPIIAMFNSGYDLWVSTGLVTGLINFAVITDQREVVDENGDPILDKDGNIQIINGDFRDRGWWNSFQTTLNESLKMAKELCQKPARIKSFTHATFLFSSFLLIGPVAGLLGFKKLETVIRNTASIASETALLFHKNIGGNTSKSNNVKDDYKKIINLKSPVAQAGILWIGTAITDLLKRFDFISERANNLTHLSLFFDRAASIRFTQSVLNMKKN